jgi:hypothetical protein
LSNPARTSAATGAGFGWIEKVSFCAALIA